jgi:hypothetical protein
MSAGELDSDPTERQVERQNADALQWPNRGLIALRLRRERWPPDEAGNEALAVRWRYVPTESGRWVPVAGFPCSGSVPRLAPRYRTELER